LSASLVNIVVLSKTNEDDQNQKKEIKMKKPAVLCTGICILLAPRPSVIPICPYIVASLSLGGHLYILHTLHVIIIIMYNMWSAVYIVKVQPNKQISGLGLGLGVNQNI
jgi:hypothetical protein